MLWNLTSTFLAASRAVSWLSRRIFLCTHTCCRRLQCSHTAISLFPASSRTNPTIPASAATLTPVRRMAILLLAQPIVRPLPHPNLLDRLRSALPHAAARLPLRPPLRRGIPQTSHSCRRKLIRLLPIYDLDSDRVLPIPPRAWNRGRTGDGHHVLPERIDAEPPFREEQIQESGVRRPGEREQCFGDSVPDSG